MSPGWFLNGLICLVCTVLGVTLAFSTSPELQESLREQIDADPRMVLGILTGGLGYLFGATFAYEFDRWLKGTLPLIRIRDVIWGGVGAVLGMVAANLLVVPGIIILNLQKVHALIDGTVLASLLFPVGVVLVPLTVNLFFAYVGATTFLAKEDELSAMLLGGRAEDAWALKGRKANLLDTSAIIDGRVLDLLKLGLLDGQVVVPRFVVHELQLLADSKDDSKRGRGQRGLEILEAIKAAAGNRLTIPEQDFPEAAQVDEKLVRQARTEPSVLITNDYNLAKIASLEGIGSISLHALADVMRPQALPGDALELEIVKEGKEKGQGVGYLSDGTMVVVRDGLKAVGRRERVTVEKVLQTSAGRMIFSKLAGVPASIDG